MAISSECRRAVVAGGLLPGVEARRLPGQPCWSPGEQDFCGRSLAPSSPPSFCHVAALPTWEFLQSSLPPPASLGSQAVERWFFFTLCYYCSETPDLDFQNGANPWREIRPWPNGSISEGFSIGTAKGQRFPFVGA